MTIEQQEKLIDDMIKEDENYTVRDFINLRFDLLSIGRQVREVHNAKLQDLGMSTMQHKIDTQRQQSFLN